MGIALSSLAQQPAKPYYPGFRDLNLFFVAICLVAFLYLILLTTIAYRVISTRAKLRELEPILAQERGTSEDPRAQERFARAKEDFASLTAEYAQLTATAPGSWFAKGSPTRHPDSP